MLLQALKEEEQQLRREAIKSVVPAPVQTAQTGIASVQSLDHEPKQKKEEQSLADQASPASDAEVPAAFPDDLLPSPLNGASHQGAAAATTDTGGPRFTEPPHHTIDHNAEHTYEASCAPSVSPLSPPCDSSNQLHAGARAGNPEDSPSVDSLQTGLSGNPLSVIRAGQEGYEPAMERAPEPSRTVDTKGTRDLSETALPPSVASEGQKNLTNTREAADLQQTSEPAPTGATSDTERRASARADLSAEMQLVQVSLEMPGNAVGRRAQTMCPTQDPPPAMQRIHAPKRHRSLVYLTQQTGCHHSARAARWVGAAERK